MEALSWVPDDSGQEYGDPYCDWLLGVGSDFAVRNRVRRNEDPPEDFNQAFDLTMATGAPMVALLAQTSAPRDTGALNVVRFPAPLRIRSFADPKKAKLSAIWTPPQHLAGLSDEDKEKLVVVAVIDDGINVANERFVDSRGHSRVDFAWVQDMMSSGNVPFGAEISAEQIDQARQSSNDPASVLAELGLIDFSLPGATALARRASHGTHMADLAAGYGPGETGYENSHLRRMITVQLPFLMTQETSGATYAPFVAQAIEFILSRAEMMRIALELPRLPVAINWSYAGSGGPHNGAGQIEQVLASLLPSETQTTGVQAQIVMPAGNRHLARQHGLTVAANTGPESLTLPWRIQPGDQTSSFLEIWVPIDAIPTLEISTPGGAPTTVDLSLGPQLLRHETTGDVVARVALDNGGSGRRRILIAVVPTEIYDSNRQPAPAGLWAITVGTFLREGQRIEAWVQRDEAPYRFRTNARQSYLDAVDYEKFDVTGRPQVSDHEDCIVRRIGTQSGIATNPISMVVAGYAMDSGNAASYSGRGDLQSQAGAYSPSLAGISDRSASQPGILASGTLTGTALPINGTSVAAPQVTRLLADEMAEGRPTFAAAKTAVIQRAQTQEAAFDRERAQGAFGAPPELSVELAGDGRLGPVGSRSYRT